MSRKEPIYQTILNALITELNSSHFKKNDPFYSESDLRQKYQVSSTTVVRVLNTLADQGFIHRIQGKGSFVSKFNRGTAVKITDTHTYDVDAEEVAILVVNDQTPVSAVSQFDPATPTWYFERLREIKGVPFEFSQSWYLKDLLSAASVQHPRQLHSLYALIRQQAHLDLARQPFEQNYAVTMVPNQRVADYLHVSATTIVVKVERWVLQAGAPLEYTLSYLLPNYFGLHLTSESQPVMASDIR
ncbi:GntR family transcriptional regulator [Lactiplantibacillus mudanjiangensis]|uniref:Transcription regulator [Lactobacillus plantarum JDM1] n=1 Tax=Lactiplantibacillus mudanjiangensis TaxID=1296538 RepID=A0A660DYL8_9LACO|nr:GntR family transcriptional regulator [Lactiplantibacillus mudanjiangensis]VDG21009.1 transcription regulator [Lactobacillus plantarum JDM1] [Lactiplantibacillus mudanjiangensis]VDG22792.1 transcription regulator [Lactobacillus plantarum JDM1] [Lactiplantibacillus mudanjiangensis]VDG26638.1 transcription regulator [Lactobacillus plantarum JDM1] [Lactiplantibacillus mudanjiangensis]